MVPVEGTGGAVTVVCAATWRFSALVAKVAGVPMVGTGVTVTGAAFPWSVVSVSVVSPILYGASPLNAVHRIP